MSAKARPFLNYSSPSGTYSHRSFLSRLKPDSSLPSIPTWLARRRSGAFLWGEPSPPDNLVEPGLPCVNFWGRESWNSKHKCNGIWCRRCRSLHHPDRAVVPADRLSMGQVSGVAGGGRNQEIRFVLRLHGGCLRDGSCSCCRHCKKVIRTVLHGLKKHSRRDVK